MKKFIFIIVFFVGLLFNRNIFAQYPYPVAISKYGALFGKYKSTIDTRNSIPDTISLEEARSIYALNAFNVDKIEGPHKLIVSEFQMTIINKGSTTKLICKTEIFSEELLNKIRNLKAGSNLYFEGIKAKSPKGETASLILLAFYIK